MAIKNDPDVDPRTLLADLYSGDLILLSRLPAVAEMVVHVRDALEELFDPHPPEQAHQFFSPEEMAKLLGRWKPAFIHSERSKTLVREIIEQAGFDPNSTHYDVPKPRTSFPQGHLTTGIAFAFPWHRDTWYAAPAQQINWWLPIYPAAANNAMSFDQRSFDRSVDNNSAKFDYYRANSERLTVASQVSGDTRVRPEAIDHHPAAETIVLPAPGTVLLFSGANLHTSIPNTSDRARYSVDFRTVDTADVRSGRGAPMGDVACTGTAIRDFVNVHDGSSFAEQTVREIFGSPPADVMLVFDKAAAQQAGASA